MASRKQEKERLREERERRDAEHAARERRARKLRQGAAGGAFVAVALLAVVFVFNAGGGAGGSANAGTGSEATRGSGKYPFAVGKPGPGENAPVLQLGSTAGGTYDLASRKGKTVLLYFHEGLMCQPCVQQISDIEANWPKFQALGIDEMVAVSGDELENLEQAASDTDLKTPMLSDPGVEQSAAWDANKYGMMGDTANGHSFVVIDPEGRIQWRADYGGKPKYTMFIPSADLLGDLKRGLEQAPSS